MKTENFSFLETSVYFTGKATKLSDLTNILTYKLEEKIGDNRYIFGYIHIPLAEDLEYKWEVKIGSYGEEGWRMIEKSISNISDAPCWFVELHLRAKKEAEKLYRLRNVFTKYK